MRVSRVMFLKLLAWVHAPGTALLGRGLQVLGALNTACFIDEDAQGLARAVQAVGQQAGTGSMQRVAAVIESGLLGRLKFGLSARRSRFAQLLRGGGLRRPGRGLAGA